MTLVLCFPKSSSECFAKDQICLISQFSNTVASKIVQLDKKKRLTVTVPNSNPHSDLFSQYIRFYKVFSFTKHNLIIFDYSLFFCSHFFECFMHNQSKWFLFNSYFKQSKVVVYMILIIFIIAR